VISFFKKGRDSLDVWRVASRTFQSGGSSPQRYTSFSIDVKGGEISILMWRGTMIKKGA
jgi:hypothetical protein